MTSNDKSQPLTEMESQIIDAAKRTWQMIGPDALTSVRCDSLSRDEVIEVVMDYLYLHAADQEVVKAYEQLSYDAKVDVLRRALPLHSYGF